MPRRRKSQPDTPPGPGLPAEQSTDLAGVLAEVARMDPAQAHEQHAAAVSLRDQVGDAERAELDQVIAALGARAGYAVPESPGAIVSPPAGQFPGMPTVPPAAVGPPSAGGATCGVAPIVLPPLKWYCVSTVGHAPYRCIFFGSTAAGQEIAGYAVGGPFDTESECKACCDRLGGGPTPPTKCEYATPPAGCQWVPGPNYDPITDCGRVLQCLPRAKGWECRAGVCVEVEGGHYATRADCEAACLPPPPPGEICPVPVECPIEPAPATTATECQLLGGAGILHAPGTAEFCASIDAIKAHFIQVGNDIFAWVSGVIAPNKSEDDSLVGWLGKLIPGVGQIGALVEYFVGDAKKQIRAALDCWRAASEASTWCQPTELVALGLVLAAVRFLRNLRFGTDALVWITIDISVTLEPAERTILYLLHHACPTEIPSMEAAVLAHLRGDLPEPIARCWIEMRGGVWETWQSVMRTLRMRPTDHEILTLANRNDWPDQHLDRVLRGQGYLDPTERGLFASLRKNYASSSDLVRYAVRHAFEPSLIQRFGFLDELSQDFLRLHAALGFGWDFDVTDPLTGLVSTTNFAKMAWSSHWVWPSPTQAVLAGARFRPGRNTDDEDPDTAALNVDAATVRLLLRGNDYPPQFREIIAGLGRAQPGLRQIRLMLKYETISGDGVYEIFRKQNYSDSFARKMTDALERQVHGDREKESLRAARLSLAGAYQSGVLDDTRFVQSLVDTGLTPAQSATALAASVAEFHRRRAEEAHRRVKAMVLRGILDRAGAERVLVQAGIRQDFAAAWALDWEVERDLEHKTVTARQLVTDACDGLVSIPDLVARLTTLRYTMDAIGLMVREAELCIMERAAKLAQRAADLQRKKIAGRAPVREWDRWLLLSAVTKTEWRQTMHARGWSQEEMDDHLLMLTGAPNGQP